MASITQLEALSSAGLIRRARKALEKSAIQWGEQTDDHRAFEFEGYQGHYHHILVEQSNCNCPAAGICKHIVAAAISSLESDDQTSTSNFSPPAFVQQELFKEAGKVITRSAYKTISQLNDDEVNIKVNDDHIEVRWLDQRAIIGSQTQLAAITIESNQRDKQLIAALLYFKSQSNSNNRIEWPNWLFEEQQQAKQQASESRIDLFSELKSELSKLASMGVAHIRPANLIELMGLVPRLNTHKLRQAANAVRALQEWVELHEKKTGLDPTQHILRQLGILYSLCEATHQELESTTDYFESLDMLCIGGHKWSAPSGALGLNMLFLSEAGKVFHSSIVRSQKGHGFSGDQAWSNQGLWGGSPLNYQLPGYSIQFTNFQLNRWGSLVINDDGKYIASAKKVFDINAICHWEQLKTLDIFEYAILKPKRWLYCEFNEIDQELELQLLDENDNVLVLRQKHTADTANRISNLLDIWKSNPEYIVIRHVIFNHSHQLEPVSLFTDKWVSLDFQKAQKASLGLLQRLLKKLQKNEEGIDLGEEEGLIGFLQQVEKELREYPYLSHEKINTYIQHFKSLGLDLAADYLSEADSDIESYLKIVYLVNTTITLAASWPIYHQEAA